MPNVWMMNVDDVIGTKKSTIQAKLVERYLWCMGSSDLMIASSRPPREYVDYVGEKRGIPDLFSRIVPDVPVGPTWGRRWFYEPSEIALKLNDKWSFKTIAQSLSIPVIPARLWHRDEDMDEMARLSPIQQVMIKRRVSAGGLGNFTGNSESIRRLPRNGTLFVEPLLFFRRTFGTVVDMSENDLAFRGVDEQIIESFGWVGCHYPAPNVPDSLREWSLAVAAYARDRGARGPLNIDWGLTDEGVVAIECNMRMNGFSYVLDVVQSFVPTADVTLTHLERYPVGALPFETCTTLLPPNVIATSSIHDGAMGVLMWGADDTALALTRTQLNARLGLRHV